MNIVVTPVFGTPGQPKHTGKPWLIWKGIILKILIDETPAGPEMDAAVAGMLDKPGYFSDYIVINGKRHDVRTWIWESWAPEDPPKGWRAGLMPKPYSTDIAAALDLIRWFHESRSVINKVTEERDLGIYLEVFSDLSGGAVIVGDHPLYWYTEGFDDLRKDGPLAICRTFLRASGVEYIEVEDESTD